MIFEFFSERYMHVIIFSHGSAILEKPKNSYLNIKKYVDMGDDLIYY